MKTYFYDNEVKIVKGVKKFIVYGIEHKGDLDIAERKVKTITQKLKRKLAGGLFDEKCIPYNFKKDYTVINIPYSTRARAYDKKDKFIHALIEAESR
jgi:hypothetical protein